MKRGTVVALCITVPAALSVASLFEASRTKIARCGGRP